MRVSKDEPTTRRISLTQRRIAVYRPPEYIFKNPRLKTKFPVLIKSIFKTTVKIIIIIILFKPLKSILKGTLDLKMA